MTTPQKALQDVNLYADRDAEELGEFYAKHVQAMTVEGLHAKSDIAAELAWRDREIARLGQHFAGLDLELESLRTRVMMLQDFHTALANEFHACGCVMGEGPKVVNARAETAEAELARCRADAEQLRTVRDSLLRDMATVTDTLAARAETAEARVREAEGLLRECVVVIHKAAEIAGIDPIPEPTPESIGGRVASFLAAIDATLQRDRQL